MSNRNNQNYYDNRGNYDRYDHPPVAKKNTGLKVIAGFALVVAVVYVITSLALGIKAGAPVWKPWEWHKAGIAQSEPGGDVGDVLGDGTTGNRDKLLNVIESNGIELTAAEIPVEDYGAYSISDESENAYLITATVEPENTVDKRLGWGTSWKNGISDWAQGKRSSDYMDVTPLEQYSNQATLTCKAAFGEPIILTIYSISDANVNCTVQLDYVKHLKNVDVVLNPNVPADTFGRLFVTPQYSYNGMTPNGNVNTVLVTPYYDIGTIEGTINVKTTLVFSSAMKEQINSLLNSSNQSTSTFHCKDTVTYEGLTFSATLSSFLAGGGNQWGAELIVNNFICTYGFNAGGGSPTGYCKIDNVQYEITYSYGDVYTQTYKKGSDYEAATPIGVRNDGLTKIATASSITPDKDSVIFY